MRYYTFLIYFGLGARCVLCFWPPAFKVDLNDRKVFVIASDDTDYEDESENEMIQAADLAQFESLAKDEEKYKPLHSHVERYNKRAARTATEFADVFPNLFEPNLEDIHNLVEEAKPFVAGFKHELDEYDFDDLEERIYEAVRRKRNVSDHLDVSKGTSPTTESSVSSDSKQSGVTEPGEKERTAKIDEGSNSTTEINDEMILSTSREGSSIQGVTEDRESEESEDEKINEKSRTEVLKTHTESQTDNPKEETSDEEDYDYHQLKSEYYEQLEYGKNDNKTFNYTDNGEPEETAKDAVEKIVDFKMPRNCTREELTEFGAKALECLAYDYKHAKNEKNAKQILSRTWIVLRVWICIYLCIAVPCWCQKGWCCCCFRCAFCNPEDRILAAKRYYAENPPGVLTEHKDNSRKESITTEFEATLFELEAYEKFESAIRNL